MNTQSEEQLNLFGFSSRKKGHKADIKKALNDAVNLSSKLHPDFTMTPAAKESAEQLRHPNRAMQWSRHDMRGKTHGILQYLHPYSRHADGVGIFVQVYKVHSFNDLDGRPYWYISVDDTQTIPEDRLIETVLNRIRGIYYLIYSDFDTYILGQYGDIPPSACKLVYRQKSSKKDKLRVTDLSKASHYYCESRNELVKILKQITQ